MCCSLDAYHVSSQRTLERPRVVGPKPCRQVLFEETRNAGCSTPTLLDLC